MPGNPGAAAQATIAACNSIRRANASRKFMHTTSYNITDIDNRLLLHPSLAIQSGPAIALRKSSVLSRQELQRLILEMVD